MIIKNVSLIWNEHLVKKIFHFWGAGVRRQECQEKISGFELLSNCVVLYDFSQRQEWNPSFVRCLWDLTKGGIRSNLTYLILRGGLMAQIILKLWGMSTNFKFVEFRFTLTVVSEEYISLTDYTAKKNYLLSSNYSCLFRSSSELKY
jgi:hypothetical protein